MLSGPQSWSRHGDKFPALARNHTQRIQLSLIAVLTELSWWLISWVVCVHFIQTHW